MPIQDIADQNESTLFDHSRFVSLRDKVLETFDQHQPDGAIDTSLDELLRHLRSQFDREEQAMQARQFKPAAAHKADHDRAYADFAERIERWKQQREREAILDFIEAGLADWFVKHVNTRDYITARFLSEGHY